MTDQPAKHGHQHLIDGPDPIPGSSVIKSIFVTLTSDLDGIGAGVEQMTPGNRHVVFDTITNRNPECFEVGNDATVSPVFDTIRVMEDGVYTVSCSARLDATSGSYGEQPVELNLFRFDKSATSPHHSRRWLYNALAGDNDLYEDWTFEWDGTGGTNRKFEIQFNNGHAAIAGTTDNLELSFLRLAVYKWPGAISL